MSTTANRIKKKYLDSNSVDGSKVLFMNEESFRAKNSSSEDIELFKLSSQNKFTLLKLPSVAIAPTDMYDIVNKKYVDDASSALEAYLQSLISDEASTRSSEDVRVLSEANAYTDSAMSQELLDRQTGDSETLTSANSYTDVQVSNESSTRSLEDSRILSESKAYTDQEIAAVINMAPEAYDTLKEIADYISSDQTGTTTMLADIADHESRLDTIEGAGEGSITKAEQDAKDYADAQLAIETAARESADANLLVYIDGSIDGANSYTDTQVAAEALLRQSEDLSIRSDLAAADASTLSSANSYTDTKLSELVTDKLGAPSGIATLDSTGKIPTSQIPQITITDVHVVQDMAARDALSVQEGDVAKVIEGVQLPDGSWSPKTFIWAVDDVTGIGSWVDIATEPHVDSINGQVGTVVLGTDDISEGTSNKYFTDTRAKTAAVVNTLSGNETDQAPSVSSVKSYVASSLDEFGQRYQVDSFTVDSTIIAQNYIELSSKAFAMTIVPSIDRLLLLEGDDYTVSVVGGKTRLTFANSVLPGGEEALEIGDKIRIRYLKDLSI